MLGSCLQLSTRHLTKGGRFATPSLTRAAPNGGGGAL